MTLAAHLAFATVLAMLSALIVRWMIRVGTIDHPGARSSHAMPTPKGGGVGIVAAYVTGLLVLFTFAGQARVPDIAFAGLMAASLGIAAVSYADDIRSWSFTVKLGAQVAAAMIAIACGLRFRVLHLPVLGAVQTGWLGVPLTAGWIVITTNAVNFIDGLNGLASGSVLIACLFLTAIAWMEGDWFVHVAALVLAAGIVGFLPFNFPRARIFMGDVGSQFCGFVLAVLGILASGFGARTLSVLLVPMMLFGILFDVAFTLCRRFLARERVTEAHRGHLYQVAQRSGLSAVAVTVIYWAMASTGGIICILFDAISGPWKSILPLSVVPIQIAWLGIVYRRARNAGITRW